MPFSLSSVILQEHASGVSEATICTFTLARYFSSPQVAVAFDVSVAPPFHSFRLARLNWRRYYRTLRSWRAVKLFAIFATQGLARLAKCSAGTNGQAKQNADVSRVYSPHSTYLQSGCHCSCLSLSILFRYEPNTQSRWPSQVSRIFDHLSFSVSNIFRFATLMPGTAAP
jgi:hypothetical protein